MTATINGIMVQGTPEEIKELMDLNNMQSGYSSTNIDLPDYIIETYCESNSGTYKGIIAD